MKAAYGRQTPAPDHEPTCVEPGSPMGELMRRYWQPVCTFDELHEVPRKEKLLCEAIVVFRDRKRRVGALDPHCAHRGTSLEWGRVEEEGLRCRYHGWLYDTEGQCTLPSARAGEDRGGVTASMAVDADACIAYNAGIGGKNWNGNADYPQC
jgi:phenylpropionate dioxygenase-like ring-hydroxylating dioxygenase large terminal subunit